MSNGVSFTIPATLTSVSPTNGVAGTQVTISGTGFGNSQGNGRGWLGSTLGTVVNWSDSQVVATVASGSTSGKAQIQQGGVLSNSVPFTVSTATITSVTPTSGMSGTQVTITGSGFGNVQGSGQVWLGTAQGQVSSWSDVQVVATVAPGSASGQAQILQSGVWSNSVAFTISGTPRISYITPATGSAGTVTTIKGTGFGSSQGSGNAWIVGAYASVVSWSNTQVVASVGAGAVTGIAKAQQNGTWSNAVAGDFRVGESTISGDRATVAVGCPGCRELGHLDSTLHLKLSPLRPARTTARAMPGASYKYDLVRSDKRWEFDRRTGVAREVVGPTQWRLNSFQPTLFLNVDTAIRYVTEMRAKWHDPTIRSNADATLAVLQRWQR